MFKNEYLSRREIIQNKLYDKKSFNATPDFELWEVAHIMQNTMYTEKYKGCASVVSIVVCGVP